jgi:hypothetical protein
MNKNECNKIKSIQDLDNIFNYIDNSNNNNIFGNIDEYQINIINNKSDNQDAGYAPNGKKRYWYWRNGKLVALAQGEYYDNV